MDSHIESYFQKIGFQKCPYEHTRYMTQSKKSNVLFISLYVNDLILNGNKLSMVEEFKESMVREFEMTYMSLISYFLGIEVSQSDEYLYFPKEICSWDFREVQIGEFETSGYFSWNSYELKQERARCKDGWKMQAYYPFLQEFGGKSLLFDNYKVRYYLCCWIG